LTLTIAASNILTGQNSMRLRFTIRDLLWLTLVELAVEGRSGKNTQLLARRTCDGRPKIGTAGCRWGL
jgi:hypothetical protein